MSDIVLYWIRQDLRLTDNPALTQAMQHKKILPVFIYDDKLMQGDSAIVPLEIVVISSFAAIDKQLKHRIAFFMRRAADPIKTVRRYGYKTGSLESII